MANSDRPQIYLITPLTIDLSVFPEQLAAVLDMTEVACLRLALATQDTDQIMRAGDALREIAHGRDIPLVIDSHIKMVPRLGLDGVHLSDGARSVRQARKDLGADAIVGAFCGTSRHDGLNAGEAGADYVCFGPMAASELGDGEVVDPELLQWWSEVIEVPLVAEGQLDEERLASLSQVTDFVALGAEVWSADDPARRLAELAKSLG